MTNSLLSVCEGACSDHTEVENTVEEQTWKHSYFFKNFKWVCHSIFQIQSHAFFRTNHLKFQAIYTKTWVEFLRLELVLEKQKHKYCLHLQVCRGKTTLKIGNKRCALAKECQTNKAKVTIDETVHLSTKKISNVPVFLVCNQSIGIWRTIGPYAGFFCQGGKRAEGPYIFKYEATFILPYIFKVK